MWSYILLTSTLIICSRQALRHFGQDRIVGGTTAKISDFPHSGGLFILLNDQGWLCGSAILNQRVLLTAAHCFELYTNKHTVTVIVGSANFYKGTGYKIVDHVIHERYNLRTITNDVALIKTQVPIKFEDGKVQRIIVLRNPPDDRVGWIAGWGLMQEKPPVYPLLLKCLEQHMWEDNKCAREQVPKGVICAEESSYSTPSFGDSGSALVVRKVFQVGVLSFKRVSPSYFAAYTSVSYYYNWIATNAKRLYCRQEKNINKNLVST